MEGKEQELTAEQQYCKAQIDDLTAKQANLNFQLDQVKASLSVFNNLLVESTKETAEEVLEKNSKDNKKGDK
tara:strand:+ start:65 stop:280 length:216 start_codon:yes stop_codon:yes gene_type:complete